MTSCSQTTATAAPTEHRILRRAEVEARPALRAQYLQPDEGKAPRRCARACARWAGTVEIEQWIADRFKERA